VTEPIPVAQYLRMSTESQLYSLPNQAAAISEYANKNGFAVIKTYKDPGRSGLTIKNRPGLTALLQDIVGGKNEYKAVLVYDVSRWGRFQDPDEAAHYEFFCKRSGIPVHYCAEQFTNDMATPNLILKFLKRTMAAEYSRELSAKIYQAMRRVAEAGLHTGSIPGYGLRRMLFSPEDSPKHLLRNGEERNLRTDRVKLVLGPASEIRIVQLIYQMLLRDGLRPADIIRELSRRGILYYGRPWSFYTVKNVLTHPKYYGLQVWGRTESKLKTCPRRVPKERWVTCPTRGPQIVSEQMSVRAHKVYYDRTYHTTNDQLLDALRRLWHKNGYITSHMVDTSQLTPAVNTYRSRFGSLTRAFELIGYRQSRNRIRRQVLQSRRASVRIRQKLIRRLQVMFPGRVIRGYYDGYIRLPEPGIEVLVSVCRATLIGRCLTWYVSLRRGPKDVVTLLGLLNGSNKHFEAFYIFPCLRMKHSFRIFPRTRVLSQGDKIPSLRSFYRAVIKAYQQLPESERLRQPELLIGVPQIARYLKQSVGVVQRLIRQGMPTGRRWRFITAVPHEVDEWVRQNGMVWKPSRDRFGRFLKSQLKSPSNRAQ